MHHSFYLLHIQVLVSFIHSEFLSVVIYIKMFSLGVVTKTHDDNMTVKITFLSVPSTKYNHY